MVHIRTNYHVNANNHPFITGHVSWERDGADQVNSGFVMDIHKWWLFTADDMLAFLRKIPCGRQGADAVWEYPKWMSSACAEGPPQLASLNSAFVPTSPSPRKASVQSFHQRRADTSN